MKKIVFLTVIAITVPLLLFAFVGCMKKPSDKADYGPEVSIDEIQKIALDIAPPDITFIKKGQYTSVDETQGIDVQAPVTFTQRLDEVTDSVDKTTAQGKPYRSLTFKITLHELIDGAWKQSVQENVPYAFCLVPDCTTASTQSLLKTKLFDKKDSEKGLTIQSLRKMDTSAQKKVTYHNFSHEVGVMPVPPAVALRPDCGGLIDVACKNGLRYVKLKFDRVIWDSEDHGTKTAFTFYYSGDIPTYFESWDDMNYLMATNQVKGCAQSWIDINSGGGTQTVPVLNCAELRDFQFGKDPP